MSFSNKFSYKLKKEQFNSPIQREFKKWELNAPNRNFQIDSMIFAIHANKQRISLV